jgi:asparagine synthase (glutamine-hydrolysing)
MFAIALWDRDDGTLVLARDRFGEKPLLYAQTDQGLVFASEYKALFCLEELDTRIDDDRLARFLIAPSDGLDRKKTTLFPSIRQVEPGHWMVWRSDSALATHTFWNAAPASPVVSGFDQAARHLRDLLTDSIALRLRSDVAVGSCLSGGLDSGSIACLIRQALGPDAPYHVFSGRFPGQSADEGPYMDAIAAHVRPIRHDVEPTPDRLLNEFGNFAWMNELPVDSGSQYAQWCVFRHARESGVTVLLDGQGADEILGGYEPYFLSYLQTNPADRDRIETRYPGLLGRAHPGKRQGVAYRARTLLARSLNRGSDIAFGLASDPTSSDRPSPSSLHDALRTDSLDGFLGTLLRYGDRNSMAHSIEVRLPFCDHRIFEFAQSLPPDYLMGDGQTKRLLREAMRGILPEPVRARWRKQGFIPPQDAWMDQGLFSAAQTVINDPAFARHPFWRPRWWRGTLDRFRAGERALAAPLWKLLATEAWRTHFLPRLTARQRFPAAITP